MLKFDEKTGFVTLPHPENQKRNLKFRVRDGYLDTADESGILWEPRRLATAEEIAMYEALRSVLAPRNECVTVIEGNAGDTGEAPREAPKAAPEPTIDQLRDLRDYLVTIPSVLRNEATRFALGKVRTIISDAVHGAPGDTSKGGAA